MARRKKKGGGADSAAWLVTFSDLMTLLLTFFVLLLSMSSMDKPLLTRITVTSDDPSPLDHAGRGRIPDQIRLLLQIVEDPTTVLEKQDRIKDLLFPNDILPPELSPGTLAENLRVLAHPEGVVIVLSEGVMFPQGEYVLTAVGQQLLSAFVPVLHYSTADVNIGGHTDTGEVRHGLDNYELSGRRAMSVLEYFLHQKFPARRFSISGYGPDKPLYPNDTDRHRAQNRRVEILLKTTQWLGRYL
ncbi:OmpA/MotB domain protein [uncultured delta proteobacterium]|uniref:OmpA/MotB domain protein n=1 Tax=uncultured delta proteobacterium TaxID=34034 RepID=A0A212J5U4_9DELT|nr:OmpA/MotB domain protein [uncultured delta proteobacterium]